MNKNAIKKYAVWARRELIERIAQRAMRYGITAENAENLFMQNAERRTVNGVVLTSTEVRQCQALLHRMHVAGFSQVIEEVAYTWFNRFAALRFMEVNGYLPSHVRVFTNDAGAFKPQILAEAIHLELEGLDRKHVYELENANKHDELFKYLLIVQCNALNSLLPGMFQKINDYTELLLPDYLLREGSVLEQMITAIPEKDWTDQVQIIGWLYQYYNTVQHEAVIDPLYGKYVRGEDIPAATQLFTPDWVVKYIVDNTVGQYWLDHVGTSRLTENMTYHVAQESDVGTETITPEDVTVFDPCVGSGHFLVYTIDILIQIYREYGYSDREAITKIIGQNLFGLDIDARAVQLAYFAVMMKGCQYDRRFLRRGIQPNIYTILDSNTLDDDFVEQFCASDTALSDALKHFIKATRMARETGSITLVPEDCLNRIEAHLSTHASQDLLDANKTRTLSALIRAMRLLVMKYAAVVTNPPYLNKYDVDLKAYVQKHYKAYSGDLFSIFIYQCLRYCRPKGYAGLMTPNVWMFIKSYEKLRQFILDEASITTLVQMAKGAFFSDASVDVCAFAIQNVNTERVGDYFRLENFVGDMSVQAEKLHEGLKMKNCPYRYRVSSGLFKTLPGVQIGYWASHAVLRCFEVGKPLGKIAAPRQGLATTDNNKYLRHWYEVSADNIGFGLDRQGAIQSNLKWFPYNKGGEFRKWYGNQDYIVNYQHDGASIKHDVLAKYPYLKTPAFVVKNAETYFHPSLSWSKVSSGNVAFRYFPQGFLYDVSGCSIFFDHTETLHFYAGFLNSRVCAILLEILSPTLNYETGHIGMLPILAMTHPSDIERLVSQNIELSRNDWDNFETSWDFQRHPLLPKPNVLKDSPSSGHPHHFSRHDENISL